MVIELNGDHKVCVPDFSRLYWAFAGVERF